MILGIGSDEIAIGRLGLASRLFSNGGPILRRLGIPNELGGNGGKEWQSSLDMLGKCCG